ncbi:phosphatase PAP2 family protein [Paracoccus sp. IB05]|uniref:phosphatase PAP2 family protein n=1 Tax=Paracoccus sp. IB05 TaxID=2779367 RepID=UPI0018E84A35|nr:phosphatase PAP2 family protein [Paracoccus sp. IB05]MBJ2153564.1 phosphatase PAP2 family protein [Paracoccus sp. IB05]
MPRPPASTLPATARFAPASQSRKTTGLTILARLTIAISFFFMIFPAADLAVTRWFADGQDFVLAGHPFLAGLRQVGLKGPYIAMCIMVLILTFQAISAGRLRVGAPHKALFVILSFVSGQMIVEALKPLIGRARPRDLLEFGGSAEFTPVWQFAGECSRNCSFASGEAAAAAAALSLLVFVPVTWQRLAAMIVTPALIAIAFNRVMFGAHFLSDVTLGWLLTLLATVWIWQWTAARAQHIDGFITRTPVRAMQRR